MKKIIIFLLFSLLTISTYCQDGRFYAYQVEVGKIDSLFPYHHMDTIMSINVLIEIDESKLVIHNTKLQEYYFYEIIDETPDSTNVFISNSIFVDTDSNSGIITYSHNKFNNIRTIYISYNKIYLKYYLR